MRWKACRRIHRCPWSALTSWLPAPARACGGLTWDSSWARITLKSHSALGQAAQRCASLSELMLLLERYYHMVTPAFAVRYVPGPSHCEWCIRVAALMSPRDTAYV